jgi:hypothetical protein
VACLALGDCPYLSLNPHFSFYGLELFGQYIFTLICFLVSAFTLTNQGACFINHLLNNQNKSYTAVSIFSFALEYNQPPLTIFIWLAFNKKNEQIQIHPRD